MTVPSRDRAVVEGREVSHGTLGLMNSIWTDTFKIVDWGGIGKMDITVVLFSLESISMTWGISRGMVALVDRRANGEIGMLPWPVYIFPQFSQSSHSSCIIGGLKCVSVRCHAFRMEKKCVAWLGGSTGFNLTVSQDSHRVES